VLEHSWVLGVLLFTSLLGIFMLRHHRLIVIQTLLSRISQGRLSALLWVARYYVAAILFAFPGILTDIFAIFLLMPWQGKMARPVSADEVIEAEFQREKSPDATPLSDETSASFNKRNKH
jgi:UPF0716 protein FxsA